MGRISVAMLVGALLYSGCIGQGNTQQDTVQSIQDGIPAGTLVPSTGSTVILSNENKTTVVMSGVTSDGNAYVLQTTTTIEGNTLRQVDKIYNPATKTTKTFGYTLDLNDPNAVPVPINFAV